VEHHGRGLFHITKNKALVEAIKGDFHEADVPQKDIAMLEYAVKLTQDPCSIGKSDLGELKKAGFRDNEILDIVQIVAYYAFVNRTACGLGVTLEANWADGE
jgi:uncharacterized peroxidase-related enzyme